MFTNFIYLIVVLLIYTTYQPSDTTNFSFIESILFFFLLNFTFLFYTYNRFKKLEATIFSEPSMKVGRTFDALLSRQFTFAIILFIIDIYVLNLPTFFYKTFPFTYAPTLLAIIFLSIFIGYQAIIWYAAYPSYRQITQSEISRKSYILSNIRFSLPMLLPWLVLSGTADIIQILPFDFLKGILSTPYGQVAYFLVFLIFIAIYGPALIQKFWQCTPLEKGLQRKRIEHVCKNAGVGYSDILNWPIFSGKMITAGVMGLAKRFRYILVTKGLFYYLDPEEIDAVIAHEIGHVKKHHLIFYLLFFSGYIFFSYATFNLILLLSIYLGPVFSELLLSGVRSVNITSTILTIFLIINFVIYFRYIFGFFMRNFERQADAYVYTLYNSAQPLISTLKKISATSGQSPDKPNWHHYSIKERVDYLNKCEKDRRWVKRHDNKIRKSIFIFCLGLLITGILGYMLNFGQTGKDLTANLMERILLEEINNSPYDFNLYNALGDVYYQKNLFEKTIKAYEKSLSLSMENPHALNNLAWLYATCKEMKFRDPKRALELASKAVDIKKEPHILDTLAESYYANGRYSDAIAAEMAALDLAKSNRSHYEKQLNKYRQALENRK